MAADKAFKENCAGVSPGCGGGRGGGGGTEEWDEETDETLHVWSEDTATKRE